tara:strand:+ start:807 stop:1049 length:243 start_codon:yes stop_codon:yes gene_type:complete
MNVTNYTIKFAKIWNASSTRDEAHARINKELHPDLTYKTMMGKVNYMRTRGVELVKLHRDSVDWAKVCSVVNQTTTTETS